MPRYRSYGGTGGRASLAAAESWQKARVIVDDDREGSFTSTRSNRPLLPFVVEEQVNIRSLAQPRAVEPNRERCSMPSCAIVTPAGEHQRPRRRKQSMGLTLEEANRILRGTLAKAQELNIKISAAICDPGGRPIALQRMDNTMWASAYAAQGKAVVSAAFGRPSGEMAERPDMPALRGLAAAEGGHMIMAQGAVPIIRNGVVEGACGVSGGTSQQDEDCARAGVAQL